MTTTAEQVEPERLVLPVAEVFTSFQGEGPACGRRSTFIRFGGCNLRCGWCDTPYTWDETRFDVGAECPDTPVTGLADRVFRDQPGRDGLVVLTGGEPLMHQRKEAMRALLAHLRGREVHVETNGTIAPVPDLLAEVALFVVSPKLSNNGADPEARRIRPAALDVFAHLARVRRSAAFKFVVDDVADLVEVAALVEAHDIPARSVWIMPEGTSGDDLLTRHREIAAAVLDLGWNTSTRLHVLLWGSERAR